LIVNRGGAQAGLPPSNSQPRDKGAFLYVSSQRIVLLIRFFKFINGFFGLDPGIRAHVSSDKIDWLNNPSIFSYSKSNKKVFVKMLPEPVVPEFFLL
jgi:hypothetical protein